MSTFPAGPESRSREGLEVVVVIPAHDEERLIRGCLASVRAALEAAGVPSFIVVVAHRCSDGTAEQARRSLGGSGAVVVDDVSQHVSAARRTGARSALERFAGRELSRCWLLSTDADTVVPVDWVEKLLIGNPAGTEAVAGLADLDSWAGLPLPGQEAYRELVAAGVHGETHEHAYAANLAVRADAYLAVGGWPPVVNGEEHALLSALVTAGHRVLRTTRAVVITSARQNARANGGLGDLLSTMARPASAVPAITVP